MLGQTRNHWILGTTAVIAASISPSAVRAGPTVMRETPTACTVINQQDIHNAGTASVEELVQKLPSFSSPGPDSCPRPPPGPVTQQSLIDQNAERAAFGLPPFRSNPILEQTSQIAANYMALTGQPAHSDATKRAHVRENLAEGPADWSVSQLDYRWRVERKYIKPGDGIYPDVCNGDWSQCAHETQILWPTTTDIGCATATGGGFVFLVCHYFPAGNIDGRPFGPGVQIASNSTPPPSAQFHDVIIKAAIDSSIRYAEEIENGHGAGTAARNNQSSARTDKNDCGQGGSSDAGVCHSDSSSSEQAAEVPPPTLPPSEVVTGHATDVVTPPELPPREVVTAAANNVQPPDLPRAEVTTANANRGQVATAPSAPSFEERIARAKTSLDAKIKNCEPVDAKDYQALVDEAQPAWDNLWKDIGKALRAGAPVNPEGNPAYENWHNADDLNRRAQTYLKGGCRTPAK